MHQQAPDGRDPGRPRQDGRSAAAIILRGRAKGPGPPAGRRPGARLVPGRSGRWPRSRRHRASRLRREGWHHRPLGRDSPVPIIMHQEVGEGLLATFSPCSTTTSVRPFVAGRYRPEAKVHQVSSCTLRSRKVVGGSSSRITRSPCASTMGDPAALPRPPRRSDTGVRRICRHVRPRPSHPSRPGISRATLPEQRLMRKPPRRHNAPAPAAPSGATGP